MYVVVGLHYIISHDTVSISYNLKLCLLKTQYTFSYFSKCLVVSLIVCFLPFLHLKQKWLSCLYVP